MKISICLGFLIALNLLAFTAGAQMLGDPVDVSQDFKRFENAYFVGSRVGEFDTVTGNGMLAWDRYRLATTLSFNKVDIGLTKADGNEFPGSEYDATPNLPFSVTFVDERTVRIRFASRNIPIEDAPSLMLDGPVATDGTWKAVRGDGEITYTGRHGKVRITLNPWNIEFYDAAGKLLTRTRNINEPHSYLGTTPFSFVRRASDLARRFAATFELAHDEKIFGCGESFTGLNKRGQKINAFTRDAMGVQGQLMYKPVPFFLSSNGYGMFVHTSAPVTFDFGQSYDQHNVIYSADDTLDLFVFLGEPKDVLGSYTAVTGRSPVPPLWSFGFWMSRITYKSEAEVREVADKLRRYRIPADVIHLDTGWFETDWRSDFRFSGTRFADPEKMIKDLRDRGFRVSLWQYTYFTPKNKLFAEIVDNGYAVRNEGGKLPFEDAVLDMSNPAAVDWYQGKLAGLLKMGVGAIKVDFGEGAPLSGLYFSGKSGLYEHNLYPLRYNRAVAEITKRTTGDSIIWARSAWAGSQRYPLHWGGDAENTDSAMAAELRGGLSFGLSGFTYWSHDVGGFVDRAPRDLYRRWLAFGALTSHVRAHGAPPREPWEYDEALVEDFRKALGLRYSLMPYIYAQAKAASEKGFPMLRTLFFEFPQDRTSWTIDDEYMFGDSLLVAPLFREGRNDRETYLPPGNWVDYQSGKGYDGGRWHRIEAGPIPVILLVREGAVLPRAAVAQNTGEIDWSRIELRVYGGSGESAEGKFALPGAGLKVIQVKAKAGTWEVSSDPYANAVKWTVTPVRAMK